MRWYPSIHEPRRFLFSYFILAAILCVELFIPGRTLYRWDTFVYTWPLLVEARAQILSGHMPFWADGVCAGTPLLENINAGVLYPLRLICWFLPLKFGFSLFLLVHTWLSLVATHLFLQRACRTGAAGAFVGALAYVASGYARGMWDTLHIVALPWIPLGLVALCEAARPGRFRFSLLTTAMCWALLLLSGDLQATVIWTGVALLLAVAHPARKRLILAWAAAVFTGVLVSAVQWLPAFDAAQTSYRASGLSFAEATERSFHPKRLLDLILPYAFGNRDTWHGTGLMGAGATKLSPWTCSIHLGVLTLLPILFATRKAKRNLTLWAIALMVGALLLSFGRFLPGFSLWHSIPVVSSFRYPEKYLLWFTLGACVLAGMGFRPFAAFLHRRLPSLRGGEAVAAAIIALSIVPVWFREIPTTSRFDPLSRPVLVDIVKQSPEPMGRVLRDRAATVVPLPSLHGMRPTERQAVFYREGLNFNTPRVWGLRSAEGFSPTEPAAMRTLRLRDAAAEDDTVAPPDALVRFCRNAAVRWLVTTPQRLRELGAVGLVATAYETFGQSTQLVLASVSSPDARIMESNSTTSIKDIWRARPGFIRINLHPGPAATLHVAETYTRGWTAENESDEKLDVVVSEEAFVGVKVPAGTTQVRLTYRPALWHLSLLVSGIGLAALIALGLSRCFVSPVVVALLATLVLGLAARGNWSCTFDEGFHTVRGMTRLVLNDSRLCYFHPPLQNALCGYFAHLAHGDRISYAIGGTWDRADVSDGSVDFAAVNRSLYPDLIQASRWGSLLLLLLLVAVGVTWAGQAAGPVAAWLAAAGLALNPSLITHGNLTTTDIGICAFVVTGSWCCWRFHHSKNFLWLLGGLLAFVAGSSTKFSGLLWLGVFLVVCVPMWTIRMRRPGLLVMLPLGAGLLVCSVLVLYGPTPQAVRVTDGWFAGLVIPGGRYLEGLVQQTDHALTGHRAFFNGHSIMKASWWYVPVVLALKTPILWALCGLVAASTYLRRRGDLSRITPFLPFLIFALLLCVGSKLALGIRHALPLVVMFTLATSVWAARIRHETIRQVAALLLAVSAASTAVMSYPSYLSYFNIAAGGVQEGHRWTVDSNYDWGQDAGIVEEQWAALTKATGGYPPRLIYFGFIDPAYIYGLDVAPGSYLGFMNWRNIHRNGTAEAWRAALDSGKGPAVASLSALRVQPNGIVFPVAPDGDSLGRIGTSYLLLPER